MAIIKVNIKIVLRHNNSDNTDTPPGSFYYGSNWVHSIKLTTELFLLYQNGNISRILFFPSPLSLATILSQRCSLIRISESFIDCSWHDNHSSAVSSPPSPPVSPSKPAVLCKYPSRPLWLSRWLWCSVSPPSSVSIRSLQLSRQVPPLTSVNFSSSFRDLKWLIK